MTPPTTLTAVKVFANFEPPVWHILDSEGNVVARVTTEEYARLFASAGEMREDKARLDWLCKVDPETAISTIAAAWPNNLREAIDSKRAKSEGR